MPTISIITPVYNAEKTIAQTIQSVLEQTYRDFEFLIINDGSTDRTLEIISTFQDPRIQVFSYPNSGHSISRNRGLENASGHYVSFLDADDIWTPEKLETQLTALRTNPSAGFVYSWSNFIDEEGAFLHKGSYFRADGQVYQQLLVRNFIENGSNPMIRKEVFDQVGMFNPNLAAAPDWDMWLRIAKGHEFVCVPEVQILYRVSTQSVSANLQKLEAANRWVIAENFATVPDALQPLQRQSLANLYLYLTFRSFSAIDFQGKRLLTLRYLVLAIVYDFAVVRRRSRLMAIMLLKTLMQLILGVKLSQTLLNKLKRNRHSEQTINQNLSSSSTS
jgi:glycosyltransferase involved in cell wall biosynthesis